MEQLIHYVWKHKIFPLQTLHTTGGATVEVIDPGLPNPNAGPDFFNAKLKLDGTLWVGNVEIHLRASDWLRHGHDRDKAYNSVILHVVGEADCDVYRTDGQLIPQLVLTCPPHVRLHYDELRRADIIPPCYSVLPSLSRLTVYSWLAVLQAERFEAKAQLIRQRLERHEHHWEDVFFITLARNFGFGLNSDAFEAWAERLPLRAVDKHRDQLVQVEALFLGQAGLLEEEPQEADDYYRTLKKEFAYLSHKFQLPAPLPLSRWRFLRLRPGAFPHIRLAQLAMLYHREQSLLSRAMEAEELDQLYRLFTVGTSPYWDDHYLFCRLSARRKKVVGSSALNLIIINTVIPFLYAYGRHKADSRLCERASRFLESLKPEANYITRQWEQVGLSASSAADSQALIQLRKEYCDKKDCLRCRFGYEFLRRK